MAAHQVDGIIFHPNIDRDVRIDFHQTLQARRQPVLGERERNADDELRAQFPFEEARGHGGDLAERPRYLRIDGLAGVGEGDAVAASHEELLAEMRFEIADLLAHGGRGDAELGRRERELTRPAATSNAFTALRGGSGFTGGLRKIFFRKPNNFRH